jgi:hypothetical protein
MRLRALVAFALTVLAVLVIGTLCLSAPLLDGHIYFNLPLKTMYAEPTEEANVVYEFPIDVRILGMTRDKNWFKVSMEFDLLFLGHYKYSGWVHAPLGDMIEQEKLEQQSTEEAK